MTNIDTATEFDIKLMGVDVINIITALGEIPHKFAAPIEKKIVDQVMAAQKAQRKEKP